jgi:hypothetical protein
MKAPLPNPSRVVNVRPAPQRLKRHRTEIDEPFSAVSGAWRTVIHRGRIRKAATLLKRGFGTAVVKLLKADNTAISSGIGNEIRKLYSTFSIND